MKATFSTSVNVINAACDRAGLRKDHSFANLAYDEGAVCVLYQYNNLTFVIAKPNSLMRLIGALADDGQDCLVSVS